MWQKKRESKRVRDQVILALVLAVGLLLAGLFLWRLFGGAKNSVEVQSNESSESQDSTSSSEPSEEPKKPQFNSAELQNVLDQWNNAQSSTASVVLMDDQGQVLASTGDIDQQYFAASMYKLYVAYFGYQQVDNGEVDPDEVYLGDWSRSKCLDETIRSSHSPCAEKLWAELGKENLTNDLKELGISNTNMTSLSTTARDVGLILAYIARSQGLSSESQANYLSSMKDQDALCRRGLPSGFSEALAVHNKVGWNEQVEWHDGSIVIYPDGRKLIIAVLTESVGSKKIASLATSIEQATISSQ